MQHSSEDALFCSSVLLPAECGHPCIQVQPTSRCRNKTCPMPWVRGTEGKCTSNAIIHNSILASLVESELHPHGCLDLRWRSFAGCYVCLVCSCVFQNPFPRKCQGVVVFVRACFAPAFSLRKTYFGMRAGGGAGRRVDKQSHGP